MTGTGRKQANSAAAPSLGWAPWSQRLLMCTGDLIWNNDLLAQLISWHNDPISWHNDLLAEQISLLTQ